MEGVEKRPPRPWRKILLRSLLGLCVYFTAEAFLPPAWQPSARVSIALLHGYQKVGSPVARAIGAHCRYEPTCSHYAVDAITHYGTLPGVVKALGRLWRCSPWGGSGYDPAL